ncbi:hypothetical protein V6N13_100341 [Hibiscus sabdariffa]
MIAHGSNFITENAQFQVAFVPGYSSRLPAIRIVNSFGLCIDSSRFQVVSIVDYRSGLSVTILGQTHSFCTWIFQFQFQVEWEFPITPRIMTEVGVVLFRRGTFTEIECAQLVDNLEYDPSLAGDVKFGLVDKLLSPKLAIENTFVRTIANIWMEEHAEVFPLKNGVFLFKFLGEQQLLSIIRHEPLLFDGEPFYMVPFDPTFSLSNLGDFLRLPAEFNVNNHLLRCVMIGKYSNGKNRLCPDPKVVTAKTIPYGPWMRAPIETRRPLPSQRWGVVYWHPTIVGDSTITWPKQPLPNLSNAPQQVHNSGIGISEKEHDVLAEIADELGVDSLMFAGSTVGTTVASVRWKTPLEPFLIQGIDRLSSSKGAISTTLLNKLNYTLRGLNRVLFHSVI